MLRLLVVTSLMLLASAKSITFDQVDDLWETYKTTNSKKYIGEMETARKQIFVQNLQTIERHNAEADFGLHSYWLGINQFADMSNSEFRKFYNGYKMPTEKANSTATTFLAPANIGDLPPRVDWRKKGYVTPVKNQGQCGSCWAFSSTGSMEGQHYRKTGKMVPLSEQNLVDCARAEGAGGCNGGWMDEAFQYVEKNRGIDTEEYYPYEGRDNTCRFVRYGVGATIHTHADIMPRGDEDALQKAVATQGPISIAIDATKQSFQLYSHGVYDEPTCSSTELDHAVLIVGYDTSSQGEDYWIVKNSWSTSWGLKGFIYMSRNKNNQCGIATRASYPIV